MKDVTKFITTRLSVVLVVVLATVLQAHYTHAENWTTFVHSDVMTGEDATYILSGETLAMQTMGFPYGDTRAQVIVGRNAERTWVYLYFTNPPNIMDATPEYDGQRINTRVKYGDVVVNEVFTQDHGDPSLHFENYERALNRIKDVKTMIVELNWYGSGEVHFELDVAGLAPYLE